VSLIDFDTVDRLEISLQFAGDELTVETGLQQWQHLRSFVASRELASLQRQVGESGGGWCEDVCTIRDNGSTL